MTSPARQVVVACPTCGESYEDWYRASLNLNLDDFDEEYIRQASSATCPACGYVVALETLVVEGNLWRMQASPGGTSPR